MIEFPNIRPYIFEIGPIQVRWYGLMYLFGFVGSYLLVRKQIKKKGLGISKDVIESLYFYMIIGLILGARLGYVIFYNLSFYIKNPFDIFAVWHGGMSFHGGLIGAVICGVIFVKRRDLNLAVMADMVTVTGPVGLMFGRIGNFINGELFGRVTDVPWAMIFPEGGNLPRHPSQLYEAFLEGPVLFAILWILKDRIRADGLMMPFFLIFYGIFRFIIEFFREPDPQIGLIFGTLTMGQMLCSAMIAAGIFIIVRLRKRQKRPAGG
ncbi:MAG: prolipoprotein diacylglyceryl transferase [Nitrospirota bacterium]|nr:MAG: prolipoprotein diacylglyceryl transferase [Nitrospirota bacterium]